MIGVLRLEIGCCVNVYLVVFSVFRYDLGTSVAIYLLLRLIAWNLTTRCLAVNGGGSVLVSAADKASPAGFWAHYTILIYSKWRVPKKPYCFLESL